MELGDDIIYMEMDIGAGPQIRNWVMQLPIGKTFHGEEIQKHCPERGWIKGMAEKQEIGINIAREVPFLNYQIIRGWSLIGLLF